MLYGPTRDVTRVTCRVLTLPHNKRDNSIRDALLLCTAIQPATLFFPVNAVPRCSMVIVPLYPTAVVQAPDWVLKQSVSSRLRITNISLWTVHCTLFLNRTIIHVCPSSVLRSFGADLSLALTSDVMESLSSLSPGRRQQCLACIQHLHVHKVRFPNVLDEVRDRLTLYKKRFIHTYVHLVLCCQCRCVAFSFV